MSDKRVFEVGYIEYPETITYYRSIRINESDYPELEGKSDEEAIQYIKDHAYEMSSGEEFYDSLGEELADQDVIREKIPHVGSEVWVEVSKEPNSEDSDEEEYDEEDD